MSWNEPGGGKGPRDPWGGKDQGPPDLDEALRKLQDQLNGLFGGRSGGGGKSRGDEFRLHGDGGWSRDRRPLCDDRGRER